MVKRIRVLGAAEAEAGVPYEQTALARRAPASRRRLAMLLLLGAGGMLVEAGFMRQPGWLLGALALGLTAWGVQHGRLGAVIAAGLAALLCALVPLGLLAIGPRDAIRVVTCLVVAAYGAALLPDVVLLARDAELQHAYGVWARREG